MRILVTGMSGTGKSTLMSEFASRGYFAVDVDDPTLGLTYPRADGELGWNVDAIRTLLRQTTASPLFMAGCADEQAELYSTLRERLASRVGNEYGKTPEQLAAVLRYVETGEPLLRRDADLEIATTIRVDAAANIILEYVDRKAKSD